MKEQTQKNVLIVLFAIMIVVLLTIFIVSNNINNNYSVLSYNYNLLNANYLSLNDSYNRLYDRNTVVSSNYQVCENSLITAHDELGIANNKLKTYPSFLDVAHEIASAHTWHFPDYICTDFAYDLSTKLISQGWSVDTQQVYWNYANGTCPEEDRFHCKHTIVMLTVPIESTTGKIITPDVWKLEYRYR